MYNSQYYTCEQIDQRLLQGYLDDYNAQTGQSLTKAQFLTKLGNIFSKEGVIDNIATQIGYYECDTVAGTAAKAITVANYALFAGGSMKVKFVNKNTANNATLNINSQGAKALYYQGERASSTNSWDEGEVVEIYYDGTSYYANNVKGGSGSGVYDVSVEHPTSGPNEDGKFTLEYILNSSNVNELIPVNKRYPGMSIQFVSIYDSKYVQFRLMTTLFSITVSDWQGVDTTVKSDSHNLLESGAVFSIIGNGFTVRQTEAFTYLRNNLPSIPATIKLKAFNHTNQQKTLKYGFWYTNGYHVEQEIIVGAGEESGELSMSINSYAYPLDYIRFYDTSFQQDEDVFWLINTNGINARISVLEEKEKGDNDDIKKLKSSTVTIANTIDNVSKNVGNILVLSEILKGKRISVIGDSISTYGGYNCNNPQYPSGDVTSTEMMWFNIVCAACDATIKENLSVSGGTVMAKTNQPIGLILEAILEMNKTDVMFLCGGLNDSRSQLTVGNWEESVLKDTDNLQNDVFSDAYTHYIREGIAKSDLPIVIIMPRWVVNNRPDWLNAARNICNYYKVPLIDLTDYESEITVIDTVHPNKAGQKAIANYILNYNLNHSWSIQSKDSFKSDINNIDSSLSVKEVVSLSSFLTEQVYFSINDNTYTENPSSAWRSSDFLDISVYQNINTILYVDNVAKPYVAFFNANKQYVRRSGPAKYANTINTESLLIPNGAKYMKLQCLNSQIGEKTCTIKKRKVFVEESSAGTYVIKNSQSYKSVDVTGIDNAASYINGLLQSEKCIEVRSDADIVLSEPIKMVQGSHIRFAPNTVIKVASDIKTMVCNKAFFDNHSSFANESNISVEGGIWDATGISTALSTGAAASILFVGVDSLDISNLTLRNCARFAMQVNTSKNLHIHDIIFENSMSSDSIHLGGDISDFIIERIHGYSGDDMVALNAWDWKYSSPHYGNIKNGVVRDINCISAHAHIIRLLGAKDSDTDSIYTVENVKISNINGAGFVSAFDIGYQPEPYETPSGNFEFTTIKDVVIENCNIKKTADLSASSPIMKLYCDLFNITVINSVFSTDASIENTVPGITIDGAFEVELKLISNTFNKTGNTIRALNGCTFKCKSVANKYLPHDYALSVGTSTSAPANAEVKSVLDTVTNTCNVPADWVTVG